MDSERPANSRLRNGRHSAAGQIYLITSVTRARRPVFDHLACARVVVRSLVHADRAGWSRTFAYVLMPDHLHWLFELGEGKTLDGLMCSVNGFTSRALAKNHGVRTPLWQDGYHDRALRESEDVRTVSRYIVANPLRANLCDDIGAYPHWDAVWMDAFVE